VAQLLAFSRQQLVRRRVLDLNVVVTESARMLARMIGSDIELGDSVGYGRRRGKRRFSHSTRRTRTGYDVHLDRHYLAGLAVTALWNVHFNPCLLDRMKVLV
jgi:hypothetical protein